MPVDLDELLENVNDEQSFIAFVQALGCDFARERLLERSTPSSADGSALFGWENGSVDTFLDAAAAWASADSRNSPSSTSESNVWQRCAEILLAGKFYE